MGIVTFGRLMQLGMADGLYLRAINRIIAGVLFGILLGGIYSMTAVSTVLVGMAALIVSLLLHMRFGFNMYRNRLSLENSGVHSHSPVL